MKREIRKAAIAAPFLFGPAVVKAQSGNDFSAPRNAVVDAAGAHFKSIKLVAERHGDEIYIKSDMPDGDFNWFRGGSAAIATIITRRQFHFSAVSVVSRKRCDPKAGHTFL